MNDSLEAKVQWLVDRAQISDLLYGFASALDCRDWQAYVDNYDEGAYIELPDPTAPGATIVLRKEHMIDKVPKSLGRYRATHHISSNHQISIDAEQAHSRSYLQAVHVTGTPTEHWTAGGWYDCDYRRTARGWKFVRVRLSAVWLSGEVGSIRPE